MSVILIKVAVSIIFTALIFLFHYVYPRSVIATVMQSSWILPAGIVIFRVIPFIAIYLIIGLPAQSDVVAYFWPQASAALEGQLIYRDFDSHYAPIFPYILSGFIMLWSDPRSIVLGIVLVEILTLLATYQYFRQNSDIKQTNKKAALVYLMSPAPFLLVLLGGQEDLWLWSFALGLFWFITRGHSLRAGLAAGLGLLVTKALFILAVVPVLWIVRRVHRYLAGLLLISVISVIPLWQAAGSTIFMPLREGSNPSPPNIWFTIQAFTNDIVPLGNPLLAYLSLGIIAGLGCLFFWKHHRMLRVSREACAAGWVFIFCSLMLLSPKSLGNYAAIYLMPLTFLALLRQDRIAFYATVLLNISAAIQPSMWYRSGSPVYSQFNFLATPITGIEFALQLLMVVTFIVLMQRSWLWAQQQSSSAPVAQTPGDPIEAIPYKGA